jgi:hypothetical protein
MTLDDVLGKRQTGPRYGLSTDDYVSVLRAVESCEQLHDKRVLSCWVVSGGHVIVQTGEWPGPLAGGGNYALANKGENGWAIVDTTQWC